MEIIFTDEQDDPLPNVSFVEVARVAMEAENLPPSTLLSITLVEEARMSELNSKYMGQAGPTDVLSFPIEDFSEGIGEAGVGDPPLMLGDIMICPGIVRSNASVAGVAFGDEMALMVVHGILHLLGRDHVIEAEAEAMEQREQEILALAGLVRP